MLFANRGRGIKERGGGGPRRDKEWMGIERLRDMLLEIEREGVREALCHRSTATTASTSASWGERKRERAEK